MRLRRSDVPLQADASARFLPWLVAFMVYLAALALAGAIVVGDVMARWDRGLAGRMTVQVPPPEPAADEPQAAQQARVAAALEVLRETAGVRAATPLGEEEMAALLEPWLGGHGLAEELPLPALIAVRVDPAAPPQTAPLAERLQAAVPGASVDDHRGWLRQVAGMARTLQGLAAVVVALVGAAAVMTVVFVTRTGLAIHRPVIEVLHLVGAYDSYVARQFQAHALKLALKGGAIGLGLAVATLLGLGRLLAGVESPLLPAVALAPQGWAALVAVPLAAAVVATLTARLTVLRTLARMA